MTRPFLIAQLTDPHIGADWGGTDPVARLAAAVAAPAAMRPLPDVVLVTGDLADNAAGAWDELGLPPDHLRALGDVIDRHRQVRRIVAGHVHRAISGQLAGRSVLAVPSTFVQARLDFEAERIELAPEPA